MSELDYRVANVAAKTPRHFVVFSAIAQALSQRLEDPLIPSEPGARELKRDLVHVAHMIEASELEEARWELMRLEDLVTDWDSLVSTMPEYLAELRKRFMQDDQRSGYIGARAELSAAAFLADRKIMFRRGAGGEPDFLLVVPEGRAAVECTSAHLTAGKEANFYKVESAIRQKARESYCNQDTALYVEYTGILRHAGDMVSEEFPARLNDVVSATPWGAVILSCLILRTGARNLERAYQRLDGEREGAALKKVLDVILPPGEVYVGHISIPPKP
jgi:hypothetical protein